MKKNDIWSKRITYIIVGWILILAAIACDTGIIVPRYEIYTDKVTEKVRLVLISDLHSSCYGDNQEVLTKVIDGQNPDVILLAGDIMEEERGHGKSIELMQYISEKYPCYYSIGNHEEYTGRVAEIKNIVRSCGITVLEGSTADIGEINIGGVDNLEAAYGNQIELVGEAMSGSGDFKVLISHRPDLVSEYVGNGFDLVVCGHAHGGQIRIPFLLNGLYAPDQWLFPEYAGGRYLLDNGMTEMIVSRGLCKNEIPRVFNQPEVVVIDVLPETA